MASCAIVGVGRIGGEVAYLAATLGIVDELVLHDHIPGFLKAQVLDLQHTGLPVTISTDPRVIRETDICVFAAGVPRTPSVKTRADLLAVNLPATKECAALLDGFGGVLVTVTNPMDVNNFILHRTAGIPRERCIGFGGQLDSARFALALKKRGLCGKAWVLGEHGEYQVPLFSTLPQPVPESRRDEILTELRDASMEVIRGKGGTVFGPAFHIARLIRMVLENTREVVSCSAVLDGEYGISGCSLGIPALVGRNGILAIEQWRLDQWELEGLKCAGGFVQELCRTVRH
jgi:malate dehydrogenase